MYKLSHKPIKTASVSLAAALNVIILAIALCLFQSNILVAPLPNYFVCKLHYPIHDDSPPLIVSIKNNKVSVEIPGQPIREEALKNMAEMYRVDFTNDEIVEFEEHGIVNLSLEKVKTNVFNHRLYQSGSDDQGIPYQSDNSELFNWVRESRKADIVVNNRALLIAVKVDDNTSPAVLKGVEANLLKQRVNRFELITDTSSRLLTFDDNGKLLPPETYHPFLGIKK
ncbi:hypothetical protein [uncultured Mucilaginibacter sp.]|uniref:hypothetical protein n=1 Tax=uncultured Mucilaginibacter sp. TaxID=797541 RepID=UPI0025E1C768|nr:hypothetical protein [uncultured Mucilaginibacter sp.]